MDESAILGKHNYTRNSSNSTQLRLVRFSCCHAFFPQTSTSAEPCTTTSTESCNSTSTEPCTSNSAEPCTSTSAEPCTSTSTEPCFY